MLWLPSRQQPSFLSLETSRCGREIWKKWWVLWSCSDVELDYQWNTHMGTGKNSKTVSVLKSEVCWDPLSELALNSPWPFIKLCELLKEGGSIQTTKWKFSMAWVNSWAVRGNIREYLLAQKHTRDHANNLAVRMMEFCCPGTFPGTHSFISADIA